MFQDTHILKQFTLMTILGVAALISVGSSVKGSASNPPPPQMEGQKMEMPKTSEEHRKAAEKYRQKATEHRAEAEMLRKMLADGKMSSNHSMSSMNAEDMKKMRKGCERYIDAAKNMAKAADEMAEHHEMCAKHM